MANNAVGQGESILWLGRNHETLKKYIKRCTNIISRILGSFGVNVPDISLQIVAQLSPRQLHTLATTMPTRAVIEGKKDDNGVKCSSLQPPRMS